VRDLHRINFLVITGIALRIASFMVFFKRVVALTVCLVCMLLKKEV
jgi:hypothetical protein